jgi:hypothetical protein
MSNAQDRGTPILSLEDVGGLQSTSMLKADIGSDSGASSNPGSFEPRQAMDTVPGAAHQSLDSATSGSAIPDTTIFHQHESAQSDSAGASSTPHAALDASSPANGFVFASVSGHDAVNPNDSFASSDVVHSEFGASAPDNSPTPHGILSGNLLGAHLSNGLAGHATEIHGGSQTQSSGSGGDPTGQLWAGDWGYTHGNPDGNGSDIRVEHMDSDGLASDWVDVFSLPSFGDAFQTVGLDTAANLYFAEDATQTLYVGNISTGANLSATTIGNTSFGDSNSTFIVDPANDTIFMSQVGDTAAATSIFEIIEVTYNPLTGAISSPYDSTTGTFDPNHVLVDGSVPGSTYATPTAFALSNDGSTLYYVGDNTGIYEVGTSGSVGQGTAPTPELLSSQSQFPSNFSNGAIDSIAINQAQGLIYFTTSDQFGSGGGDAVWWMPIGGGTATQMSMPAGVDPALGSMAFDPGARQLYVDDGSGPHVMQLTLSADGKSIVSGNSDFYMIDAGNPFVTPQSLDFASLANESGVAGTSIEAVQGGSVVDLLTAAPVIADPQGSYIGNLAGVSVEVIGGTKGDGTSFGVTSGSLVGAAGVSADELYVNGQQSGTLDGGAVTVSWNAATQTLTLSGDVSDSEYQTLLSQVSFQESAGADNTAGSHPTRVIDLIANDGITVANPTTSDPNEQTITINLGRLSVATSGSVTFTGAAPVALDAGATVADLDGNLTGATVTIASGLLGGDTLNFTTQLGITGAYSGGVLTLSGSASAANYQTALESITYSFTGGGDPTNGGADSSRTIDWQVTDGSGSSNTGSSALNIALPDVAPAVSSLTGSATSGANFLAGYTATFTLDVSKDVIVAGGTTLSLSDGGTATYVSGSGTTSLVFSYDPQDLPQPLMVTGIGAGSIEDAAGTALPIAGTAVTGYSVAVTDSAANVGANFGTLDNGAANISSITLTDGGTPNLDLTASEVVNDQPLIAKIVSPYNLVVSDVAANVASGFVSLDTYASHISSISFTDGGTPNLDLTASEVLNDQTLIGKIAGPYRLVANDSAATVQADFDSLGNYASAIASVVFTDSGTPTLDLTATQVANDQSLLAKVAGPYNLLVSGVTGQSYTSYQVDYNASGQVTQTTDYNASGKTTETIVVNANGSETITGSADNLTLTGTNANDTFYLQSAPAVTATGGSGNDLFFFGSGFSQNDHINGGGGTNTLELDGGYTGGNALTIGSGMMTNIQTLMLAKNHSYDITLDNGTVASGATLTVQAGSLLVGDSFTFNGSTVTGAKLVIYGGTGSNNITGSAGNDTIHAGSGTSFITGGGGADLIYAGAGADTFAYNAVSDSTGKSHDTIDGFNTATDKIDLLGSLSGVTVIDTAVTGGTLGSLHFDTDLARYLGASQLQAHGAVLFTPTAGGFAGDTFLIIDENGVAGYQAGHDLVIELTHGVNLSSLSLSNFETSG